jgi:hypothetical protein
LEVTDVTRATYLQAIVDDLTPPEEFLAVEFIPFRGWHLCGEPRWFEDSGKDFIGRNWREAETMLRKLFVR